MLQSRHISCKYIYQCNHSHTSTPDTVIGSFAISGKQIIRNNSSAVCQCHAPDRQLKHYILYENLTAKLSVTKCSNKKKVTYSVTEKIPDFQQRFRQQFQPHDKHNVLVLHCLTPSTNNHHTTYTFCVKVCNSISIHIKTTGWSKNLL